jgi:hypothetical protein
MKDSHLIISPYLDNMGIIKNGKILAGKKYHKCSQIIKYLRIKYNLQILD